jgi:hypothetical protein
MTDINTQRINVEINQTTSNVDIASDKIVNIYNNTDAIWGNITGNLSDQDDLQTIIESIDSFMTNTIVIKADSLSNQTDALKVDGSSVTQPISAISLPLPALASTAQNQTTTNSLLYSIDTKTPALGQALAADSTPVVLPAEQVTIWEVIRDRIPELSNGKLPVEVGSLNVTVDNASLEIANNVGNPIPISDANSSITVDGTFWQATQPVSADNLPLPTGAATSVLQNTANTFLENIDTKLPNLTVSSTRLLVDGSGVTQPVTISSLPALSTGIR